MIVDDVTICIMLSDLLTKAYTDDPSQERKCYSFSIPFETLLWILAIRLAVSEEILINEFCVRQIISCLKCACTFSLVLGKRRIASVILSGFLSKFLM